MRDVEIDPAQIDVVSNDVYLDGVPHEALAYLREHAPVFHQRVPDPTLEDEVWVVTRAALTREIGFDPETYSSEANGVQLRRDRVGEELRVTPGTFITRDDPDHVRLRRLVARAFTPKVVKTFAAHYARLAREVLDEALAAERFDFVAEVAAELPLRAICQLLGVPEQDRARVLRWANTIVGYDDPEYGGTRAEAGHAVAELCRYTLALADARRADPGQDLLSGLACAPPAHRLADDELEGVVLLLLAAGTETTRNNITLGLLALMDHPDQLAALRARPDDLLDNAVEEITRWVSPVNYMARTVTRDTELGGTRLRAGDRVAMFYSAANRDPELLPAADRFDVARPVPHHLAFGVGRHFCLGAHLARIETRSLLAELLPRIDEIQLDGPVVPLRSSFVHGVKHLPVRVRAA